MNCAYPNTEQSQTIARQLDPKQKVLVCFADPERTRWGSELVEGCGASPVVFGDDLRWKGLLACAFTSRAAAVIGDPQLVLGLAKLARSYGMPLKIRHAFLVGAEYGPWLHDGVRVGLDCAVTEVVLEEDRRDQDLRGLEAHLLSWTSVLDCSLHKGELGLEIHVRTFQGEKIPKIPSCARLVMRPWSPEGDIPMILTENH